MGSKQFIALVAALMAVNAVAVDTMLPALPTIARTLGLQASNQQQWIITTYLLGFGFAQIVYGPLADRFGRKPMLLTGLAIFAVCSIVAAAATSFEMLLVARALQGIGSAATRVLAVAVVRDCYAGARMARVMSLSFIVFLTVPILAPSLGQIVMLFAPWRVIFAALAGFALIVMTWTVLKLPETLHPSDRMPIEPHRVLAAFRLTLTNRIAVGYMLGTTMMMGALFGFINSAQQVFGQVFDAARLFTTIFAGIAAFMAVSSLLNARIVERIGPRRVSHMALIGYLVVALVHAAIALLGYDSLVVFALLQAAMMFGFGLAVSNFSSLAMGPLGHVAGTASSVQGFVTTTGGAVIGSLIGQRFDGTTVPLTMGFAITGLLALGGVAFAERGRVLRRVPALVPRPGE